MIEPEIESFIQQCSKERGINPSWVKAIITTESNWNRYALRYEVNYSYLVNPSRFINPQVSLSTEISTQKMSWGLGQIMGALAREQGHMGFMAELLNPKVNIQQVCIRICTLKSYSSQASDVFAMYNAGPGGIHKNNGTYLNQKYVDTVNQNLLKFL